MEAGQLAGEIRAGNLSAVEVVDAVLERMERLEPVLHAFCTPRPEAAREDAKHIDADLKAGTAPGPLAGVPVCKRAGRVDRSKRRCELYARCRASRRSTSER